MNSEHGAQNAEGGAGRVLVCFALKEEAAAFRKICAGRPEVSILITGMGRKNAEKSVRDYLASHEPTHVLACGFAGGLNPELGSGVVLFATDDTALREKLAAVGAKPAKFHCASRIATTAAEKRELRRTTGADALEMESQSIHAVCRERGIPCATVRVISDTASEDLPLDFNLLTTPDLSMDYSKVALALMKSPGRIGGLLKLRRHCLQAATRLAAVLAGSFED